MKKEKKFKQKRKAWYRAFKKLTLCRYKKVEFIYRGEKPTNGAIILSNHDGTDAPMSLELYADFPVRFWGTYQMNSGLKKMYKYQSEVYYHQKKHWSLFGAKMFCLLASPLTNIFYKGLNLISTYPDARFLTTIKESVKAIDEGDNIVIFPEKSEKGYQPVLEDFFMGYVSLAEILLKQGKDVDIYTAYFKKKEHKYIFDKPVKYSVLKAQFGDREAITAHLLANCNALGNDEGNNAAANDKSEVENRAPKNEESSDGCSAPKN